MTPYSRYLRISIALIALLLIGIAAVNYRLDPLQHFRPSKYPAMLVEQGRYRLPGLARHTDAEMIIAGTSVSKMQHPRDVAAKFGMRSLNLAMDGASAHEQYLIVRLALETGRVREVIWDVNFEYLRGSPDWVSDYDGVFPAYLYDDSTLNDIPNYLLNLDTTKSSIKILAAKAGRSAYPILKPESFQEFPKSFKAGPDIVATSMKRRKERTERFRKLIPEFTDENLAKSFRLNVAALIRKYPNVKFRLYFPPFSKTYFEYLRDEAPELIAPLISNRKMVFSEVSQLPNIELHDIQSDIAFISDLTHYADPIHFDRDYHIKVLDAIHSGKNRASLDTLESFHSFLKNL